MKPELRNKLLTRYEQHREDHFDFRDELTLYCRSDVDILRKCCWKFRGMFMELTRTENSHGIDSFEKYITISSACILVFRRNFRQQECIGIIPPQGYRPEEKQSLLANQWLSYLAHKEHVTVQHGRNMGEKQIGPYKVDGYYEQNGKRIVLEFHGCFWHGCPKYFSNSTVNPVTETTMADVYLRTMEKRKYI